MARRDSRGAGSRPRKRGAKNRRAPDTATVLALKLARQELPKLGTRGIRALKAFEDALVPHRTFEVTLTAVIEMKADCPDLRHQVGQAFLGYIRDGLHLDSNYLSEVITFKEIL